MPPHVQQRTQRSALEHTSESGNRWRNCGLGGANDLIPSHPQPLCAMQRAQKHGEDPVYLVN